MFDDNQAVVFNKFFDFRTRQLWDRFNGCFRAVVVETNDPLIMHRVRFKCPDLHDWDLRPEHCPWAVVDSHLGGKRTGSWNHPCIGDWVWIKFERNHPYGPIVSGFCDPTRRKFYTYWSLFGTTPLPVDEKGNPSVPDEPYLEEYLPLDHRPMSNGYQDRYGSVDMSSAVGFFPVEHKDAPPDPDFDAIQVSEFEQSQDVPKVNEPDVKYMLRMTKYGNIFLQADQGYWWKHEGIYGEFHGDFDKDESFEIERYQYLLKLHNEDEPKETDQRRMLLLTRYGHKLEARDVGWAQDGPLIKGSGTSQTRPGEYTSEERRLSKEDEKDWRWMKLRTKAGMLFQMYDKGADPCKDKFVSRLLIDEVGDKTEKEQKYWKDKDARWIRLVTRHGFKFVLDDRGSHECLAEKEEVPRGNGVLIKGRRTPSSQSVVKKDDEKGFFWEFNENEDTNQTTWGSPLGNVVQINDRHQYIMMSSRRSTYPRPWKKLEENEFLLESLVSEEQEEKSHHLKIDHHNEYVRLKTRANKGDPPDGTQVNTPGVSLSSVNQGIEARDGSNDDDPWVEVVDADERNLWFWGKGNLVMCHARRGSNPVDLMWWFEENLSQLVIRHNESSGKMQLFCQRPIEIISRDHVNIHAVKQITVRSDDKVILTAQGTSLEVGPSGVSMNKVVKAPDMEAFFCGVLPGPGAGCRHSPNIVPLPPPSESSVPKLVPDNRGKRYNTFLDPPADKDEIEHPVTPIPPCPPGTPPCGEEDSSSGGSPGSGSTGSPGSGSTGSPGG